MEKLELKHLAPYLPYRLWCKSALNTYRFVVHGFFETHKDIFIYDSTNDEFYIEECKPILRPLSDLTKYISYGKYRSVLMEEIAGCSVEEQNEFDAYGTLPIQWKAMLEVPPTKWDYSQTLVLFEHHYDVFGLIPAGLAVDINTLNDKFLAC